MEGGVNQWKEEEKEEEEEAEIEEQVVTTTTTIASITTSYIDIQGQEISEIKDNPSFGDTEKKNITLSSSDLVIPRDLTPLYNVAIESERAGIITENIQLVKELYLESIYQKTPTQGFHCPICKSCIQKVLILDTVRQEPDAPAQPVPPFERFRCPTCFSFLIPIGSWVFPWWVRDKEEITEDAPETRVPAPDSRGPMLQAEPKITDDAHKTQDSSYQDIEIPEGEQVPDGSRAKPSRWGALASASAIAIPKKPQVDISKIPEQQPVEEFVQAGASTDPSSEAIEVPEGSRVKPSRWGALASASAIAIPKKPQVDISKIPEQQPVEFVPAGTSTDPSYQAIEIPEDEQGPERSGVKPSRWGVLASASAIATLKKPQVDVSKIPEQQKPVEEVVHDGASAEPIGSTTSAPTITTRAVQEPGSSKTWDILKSFVYGGLIESIASLSVVTSSASADATTLSILSLSLANVIGGLFVLVHHIWDLKSEQQSTNEHVDRYYLSLGKRENFYLHVSIAILSFIIFGLVPPLVYGLTFYETNEKDLTLVAVAGASVICITLLSIAKTYIQRPNTYLTYLKTVIYYLSTGAITSIIAYLAGVLIRKLLEKLGFSSESSLGFNLMQPEMNFIEKPRFGSY
ncbi:hypothetical protein QN277_023263 [Acacia crassicarpa]|uniref:Membrane protein of ER body-like protein n=1 Tax=Acacia crassicarpa TaxID=499986 RepID=A0AAE1JGX2_9FABA|nr:hypothetical protein QN277_023263 [Acacia crassicarpa]